MLAAPSAPALGPNGRPQQADSDKQAGGDEGETDELDRVGPFAGHRDAEQDRGGGDEGGEDGGAARESWPSYLSPRSGLRNPPSLSPGNRMTRFRPDGEPSAEDFGAFIPGPWLRLKGAAEGQLRGLFPRQGSVRRRRRSHRLGQPRLGRQPRSGRAHCHRH